MGIFDKVFGPKNNQDNNLEDNNVNSIQGGQAPISANNVNVSKNTGLLNLNKNDILDLTKVSSSLENIVVASGWDVSKRGSNYDLDVCAVLLDGNDKLIKSANSLVYFGSKHSKGIYLDGDNLTGEGDGDDESIFVTLSKLPEECSKIVFAVSIYSASSRGQSFSQVKNAYVRVVNKDDRNAEICRYNLSEDGGSNTAVILAELIKEGSNWNFKAVGDFTKATVNDIKDRYKK